MSALAAFYYKGSLKKGDEISPAEDTAKHIVQVLRMKLGEKLQIVNGEGYSATATIVAADKKKCLLKTDEVTYHETPLAKLHLAVAFTKNSSRNEWLLEKATELGVSSIIPLSVKRSEREKIRYDRWQNIVVSALLQSQQYYLPLLHETMTVTDLLKTKADIPQKLIAHCSKQHERTPLNTVFKTGIDTVVLIGPEGDFTEEEIGLCMEKGFAGIYMGTQRLRTETAAMAVCSYFCLNKP